eukprot:5107601-Ditylum_brightwellii.AAC.1
MLAAINNIAIQQAAPTEKTACVVMILLSYAASHPDAIIRYHASGMVLRIHLDASFMSEPEAKNWAGGHFFF